MRWMIALLLLASPAVAAEWEVLSDAALHDALAARTVRLEDGLTLDFKADGTALNGEGVWGEWRAESGRLCLRWMAGAWTCTPVERHRRGLDLRLLGSDGRSITARYIDLG